MGSRTVRLVPMELFTRKELTIPSRAKVGRSGTVTNDFPATCPGDQAHLMLMGAHRITFRGD